MTGQRWAVAALAAVALGAVVTGCTAGSTTAGPSAAATVTSTAAPSTPDTTAPTTAHVTTTVTVPVTGASSTHAGGGGTTLCTPTVSRFVVDAPLGGDSHAAVRIHVTNGSSSPCVTTGYPGVAALEASGAQTAQAQRTPAGYFGGLTSSTTAPQLTLAPGQEATAIVEWSDVTSSGSACPTAAAVLFTLPDNTDSTKLAARPTTCALQVHPLLPGTTGTG